MDTRTEILIRGAGDLATGIAHRLYRAGFTRIMMVDLSKPTTVRRTVSFSQAVFVGSYSVEGVTAEHVCESGRDAVTAAFALMDKGIIPIVTIPSEELLSYYHPPIYIDAIVAKWNRGTKLADGDFVIGVGPGFTVGVDCHAVIETNRGHNLGRVLLEGSAEENTGIPGNVAGHTIERILRATGVGIFHPLVEIGDYVEENQVVAYVELDAGGRSEVRSRMQGLVRGILMDGVHVKDNWKAGDVDARSEREHCFTISDKARAIGGGTLEAVCGYLSRN